MSNDNFNNTTKIVKMKRQYTRNMKCSHEGCKECAHYTFNTQKELSDHHKRVSKWLCVRHIDTLSVLGLNNLRTSTKLVCKVKLIDDGKPLGKFWQEEKDFGTDKVSSGFQYGNGYKTYANDFPEGTEIVITASVSLPDNKMLSVVKFMEQETFTRSEVKKIIYELLQRPDILIDAINNEMTDYDSESMLKMVEQFCV